MRTGGFLPNLESQQPGAWVNSEGIPVDLMVPEQLAGPGGKNARAARIPPHDRRATRRARGLEAAVVDNDVLEIRALDATDPRRLNARVAGPAALLIAKLHKIAERATSSPDRLVDKDAHDLYRLLIDTDTNALASKFRALLGEEVCGEVTAEDSIGSLMAGRAEEGIGEPEIVARQVAILADDILVAVNRLS
jgi:hypothetical protein